MKRTKVQFTLVFVHRDERYREKISKWLASHARRARVDLDIRHANDLDGAELLLGAADRVLVDGNELQTLRSINRGDKALPIYALVERLDTAGAYNFLVRGVIPVGCCENELDAMFLTYMLLEGAMVARTPDAKGRYAVEKDVQHRATLAKALTEQNFNVRATARFLGMNYSTLHWQLGKLGITPKRERRSQGGR